MASTLRNISKCFYKRLRVAEKSLLDTFHIRSMFTMIPGLNRPTTHFQYLSKPVRVSLKSRSKYDLRLNLGSYILLLDMSQRKHFSENKIDEIHLIAEDGKSLGIVSHQQAKLDADSQDLQLHLLKPSTSSSPHAVYKMLSKKDIYLLKRMKKEKEKGITKNQPKSKELSFSTDIAGQDLTWKLKKMEQFLIENHKVKVFINQKKRAKVTAQSFYESIIKEIEKSGELDGSISRSERKLRFFIKPLKEN